MLTSDLKLQLRTRELIFGSWVSFAHPSITEIFASHEFDFLAIDLEHRIINLEQAQRIIAASQYFSVPCLAAKRGTTDNSAYFATKFGATALTQSLCKKLRPNGIRVNAVCLVLIETPGLLQALKNEQSPSGNNPKEFLLILRFHKQHLENCRP